MMVSGSSGTRVLFDAALAPGACRPNPLLAAAACSPCPLHALSATSFPAQSLGKRGRISPLIPALPPCIPPSKVCLPHLERLRLEYDAARRRMEAAADGATAAVQRAPTGAPDAQAERRLGRSEEEFERESC
jgi:hypothetical protein